MAVAQNKTQRSKASVAQFIAAIESEQKRADSKALDKLMREVSGEKPAMWGVAIIGYGQYRYAYGSGREGLWPKLAFAPRKANLTIYIMPGFKEYAPLLKKLGKHKTAKSCLYVAKLADVEVGVLRELLVAAWDWMSTKYG
jgi:Domain of unknown function (DU1801)